MLMTATHLLGRTQAILTELRRYEAEVRLFTGRDTRTLPLLESLGALCGDGATMAGTLTHLVRVAATLERSLRSARGSGGPSHA
jgi:hypothetical protein